MSTRSTDRAIAEPFTGVATWPDITEWVLSRVLREQATNRPDSPFLRVGDESYETYRETYEASRALASGLRELGVGRGDFVASGATSRDLLHGWFATNLLGGVEVWLNRAYRGQPLAHALNVSGARILLADVDCLDAVRNVVPRLEHLERVVCVGGGRSPSSGGIELHAFDRLPRGSDELPGDPLFSDAASVIFTSGTTGPSKGVLMPHAQTYVIARTIAEGLRFGTDDVFYTFHPMFHMTKFAAVYAAMIVGGRVACDVACAPDQWLARIRACGATLTTAVGTMLEAVYALPEQEDDAANPLRAFSCGPFPAAIAEDFERRFGARGLELWGMSELSICTMRPYDDPLRVRSAGRVFSDRYDVRVVDPATDVEAPVGVSGEIVVRPKLPFTMLQGYLGMPERTVEAWRNLWFHTGDLGHFDEDGYLYFVDRLVDRIRRRGENISSYDIEAAVNAHPEVIESAAVGIPSGLELDDDIKLCVVLRPGADVTGEDLLRFLAPELPHYMLPRYVEFMDALPRTRTNNTNKAQKQQLRSSGAAGAWDRRAAGIQLRELIRESTS